MKQTQIHHKLPRSKGGTDHPSNLVELTLYEHAEVHAIDFINGGEQFDFRNPFWGLLQIENPELAKEVLKEASNRRTGKPGFLRGRFGESHPKYGKKEKEETRKKKSASHAGKAKSPEHAQKLRDHLLRVRSNEVTERLNTQKWMCTVTGHISTAGPLTRYQKARDINPSNRIQII
jgi:hypothetical protein